MKAVFLISPPKVTRSLAEKGAKMISIVKIDQRRCPFWNEPNNFFKALILDYLILFNCKEILIKNDHLIFRRFSQENEGRLQMVWIQRDKIP